MEVPVLDDSMEMASPYQGHADDFDIDLDVMEDQASTTDKDMMGDDDYQDASYDMGFEPSGANDADMVDDIAEESGMIDADEQFPDVDYNAEMQYGTEKSYEAEMIEDDYDEDIDAPVPESSGDAALLEHQHTEPILPQEPPVVEQVQDQTTVETVPKIHVETLNEDSENQPKPDQQGDDNDDANIGAVEPDANIPRANHTEEPVDGTNEAEKLNLPSERLDQNEDDESYVVAAEADNEKQNTQESPVAKTAEKAADAQQPEVKDGAEAKAEETGQDHEHEPEVDSSDHTSGLYPVKVYYMDNEISLFPPAEGDTSETFFLEDESLAYEPLGKLFSSCREVLRDHVGENEVLIMDVDSLNLQLAEDSMHISKVTLYQIVDLYLRLCHNDDVAEPEALYLTLSTRLTIAAEVSDLILAASEGKGLSEIHSWDSYPEADAASEDVGAGSDDEHAPEELHDDNIPLKQEVGVEKGAEASAEGAHHEETVSDAQADGSQPAPEDDGTLGHEDGSDNSYNAEEPAVPERDSTEGVREPDVSKQEDKPDDSQHEQQVEDPAYDSEEQHTESTATITQLPAGELTESQDPAEVHDVSNDDDQDAEGESPEPSIVDDDYPNEGLEQNNTDFDEEPEPAEHDDPAVAHGNDETKFHVDESYEGFEECEHIPQHNARNITPEGDGEDNTEDTLLGDDGDALPALSEPDLGAASSDLAGVNPGSAPDTAENSLGLADDLSKSTPKESSGTEHDESTALHGHHEPLSTANDDHEELIFDDGELLDLGLPEEFNDLNQDTSAASNAPASVKRQRDDEDEFELAESPSPDAKRSRSS